MPQARNAWPTDSHNASRRSCGRSRAACWEKQRTLGLVIRPSGRRLPSCSGVVAPASQHAPRHPQLGHSPTDAGGPGGPGSGSAVATARSGTAPAFRKARRASERARGERRSGRVRGQTDHSRWSVGRGAQRIAKVAELTSAGVSGSAAHGPAGLGTVCGPKGEEASRIARACVRARAVERTRLINRGCLGVRIGWGLNTRLDPGAGGSLICIILARDKGRPPALEDVICISPGEAVLQSAVISIWIGRGGT